MELAKIRTHCLARPGTTEERPFGPDVLVFKVMGKMFTLTDAEPPPKSMNVKCDPDDCRALRAQFEGIIPGYHMDKRHWVTVQFNSDVPEKLALELIDESYDLVVATLPKKVQQELTGKSN